MKLKGKGMEECVGEYVCIGGRESVKGEVFRSEKRKGYERIMVEVNEK